MLLPAMPSDYPDSERFFYAISWGTICTTTMVELRIHGTHIRSKRPFSFAVLVPSGRQLAVPAWRSPDVGIPVVHHRMKTLGHSFPIAMWSCCPGPRA